VAIKPNIADRVKKGQGASIYFQEEEKALPQVGTQPDQETPPDKEPETPPQPEPQPEPEPQPDKGTDTGTVMGTDTVLQSMLKPSEDYNRKVYYPLTKQDDFIKKKAKKYKVSESEIVRIMFDYFMKNGKI
jgi:hypothetical protein